MLSSLDTNILIYAANEDCPEHQAALRLLEEALNRPAEWILAHQVLFEFYKALRNPKVLTHPLDAASASKHLRFLHEESGFGVCAYELRYWDEVLSQMESATFPYQRMHDAVLAVTLRRNGVTRFYSRNLRDFATAGFAQLINPIDPSR